MSVAKMMTRIVLIGKLKEYKYTTEGFQIGKGVVETGQGNVSFVIFNNDKGQNPHTKAADFEKDFKEGDLVFITGQDGRNWNEEKQTAYESVQVWDYRKATEEEAHRWVYVYVADVAEMTNELITLSFINYKDEETLFPIKLEEKTKVIGELEVGARVKVKGTIFNGLVLDYFGDGEFATERTAVEIKVLNTAAEVEEDKKPEEESTDNSGLWN